MGESRKACVVGAGPNGLAAAIVLADAGFTADVFEAQPDPGGAARTMELTLPGFLHDFGSAVHPLGVGSPFFSKLPLERCGLEWIHSPAPLAHPLDDGTSVILERNLDHAVSSLASDGRAWYNLLHPFVEHWDEFANDVLRPIPSIPKHPFLMARFGASAFLSARAISRRFRNHRTRALLAGIAAHSFLRLDEALSGAFAILLSAAAHAVGWPIPRGGSKSIATALCTHLSTLGGRVFTSSPIEDVDALHGYEMILCDVTPKQLLAIAPQRLSESYKVQLKRFRYGPGVFKVDYALSAPIPWKAADCALAATVHLGGSFEEIAASEAAARNGQYGERPFVLLVQPSLFDPSRAPQGKHTAWAYCHVPHRSAVNLLPRIENQIERFAPGFREIVLARHVLAPASLERMDANLVGGDIGGGMLDLHQFLFRPTWRHYATSDRNLFICSSSTPPGAGVHGMCGYHAARMALRILT